jgi:hypothetical protein
MGSPPLTAGDHVRRTAVQEVGVATKLVGAEGGDCALRQN